MNKTTLSLVGLLIALGAIVYFFIYAPSNKERISSDTPGTVKVSFDSSAVTKLEIRHGGKNVTLENQGGTWMLTEPIRFKANQSTMAQLAGGISHFKTGSLVSSNVSKQSTFSVDSSGIFLTITDRSNKSQKLVIGKNGPAYSDYYFRVDGSNDVYLGEGLLTYQLSQEIREWRDKTIYHGVQDTLLMIGYNLNGTPYTLAKDTANWKLNGEPIPNDVAAPVTNNLANLSAEDFVDTIPKLELAPIVVTVGNTQKLEIKFYPQAPDSSKWFVQAAGNPQVYTVGKWTAQQILKPLESKMTTKGSKKKK